MRLPKNIIRIITLCFIIASAEYIYSQDIHLSQYFTSPLNLNPANTGFFSGTHRFTLNYKNQWQSVTVPYQTASASAELHVLKRKFHRDLFGGGLQINRDKAGDSDFGTLQALFSLSYIKSINSKNTHFISLGLQTGPAQRTINYNTLTFDNQFDGFQYNPSLNNDEQFDKTGFWFMDVSAGINWFLQPAKEQRYEAGISIFHLNKPDQSFLGYSNILLDKKLIIYANSVYQYLDKTDFLPGFIYMKQGTYQEFLYGTRVRFVKDRRPLDYSATNVGLFVRHKDALIAMFGIDYKSYTFGISYDINLSKLRVASDSRGGLELSATYKLNKSGKVIPREVPCPIF